MPNTRLRFATSIMKIFDLRAAVYRKGPALQKTHQTIDQQSRAQHSGLRDASRMLSHCGGDRSCAVLLCALPVVCWY